MDNEKQITTEIMGRVQLRFDVTTSRRRKWDKVRLIAEDEPNRCKVLSSQEISLPFRTACITDWQPVSWAVWNIVGRKVRLYPGRVWGNQLNVHVSGSPLNIELAALALTYFLDALDIDPNGTTHVAYHAAALSESA